MEIKKSKNAGTLTLALKGRLDTATSPSLNAELKEPLGGINELIFDFAELEYISSAGLRVVLAAQKVMNKQGKMIIKNARENIMEVFEITGFVDILTIEKKPE
ncbi:putative anti-sigma factor antagonist BtrV [bioreactor metagenome]|uniref:Putative anti-sigma factor antagonist BtrV n=1 Tax=bioreactor metagenome TaxID=1076179 RepID=A0A645JDD0_9ZZZZ|nr:STAS domain-containing protein [Syntrophomonadaceae bacterium]